MQITPSQLTTAASAALPIQSNHETIARMSNATPSAALGVEHVEHSEESADRDANEQYIGSGKPREKPSQDENGAEQSSRDNLLQLEASDDAAPPLLDLIG